MVKYCVVCGAPFDAPPSSKKITCSPECSTKRKAASHTGKHNVWSDDAKKRLSAIRKAEGYSASARAGLAAAMQRPDAQRGEQHREAKKWVLVAPDGTVYRIINLLDWARKHAHWFDAVETDSDRERVAHNIRSGFCQIVLSMSGKRKKGIYTYKGWRLGAWPESKSGKT